MAGNGVKGKGQRLLSAPLIVNWSLSFQCNFDCRHCYTRSDKSRELDTARVLEAGEKLARAGILFANFGGGEPLLRRDLGEITRGLTESGLSCSMNSNGWLLDDAAADMVKESGFTSVGLSMDSHVAETHDEFRNRPGSFDRVQKAAERLRERKVPLTVSTVISRLNFRDLEPVIDLVQTMGAAKLYLHNFKCSGRGFENRGELDLAPAEWKDFYRQALALAEETENLEISFDDPILASLDGGKRDDAAPGSSCGKMSLHLRPNGDFTPCGFIPLVLGNVLRDDFSRMWKESPVLREMRGKSAKGKCRSCGHYAECLGGCTARAYAMTGDLNAPDPHCWVDEEEPGR